MSTQDKKNDTTQDPREDDSEDFADLDDIEDLFDFEDVGGFGAPDIDDGEDDDEDGVEDDVEDDFPDGEGSSPDDEAHEREKLQRAEQCTAQQVLDDLEAFHLDSRTKRELTGLVELLRHRRMGNMARPVRYGLLIQCDIESLGEAFLDRLAQVLAYYGLLDQAGTTTWEGNAPPEPKPANRTALRTVLGCRQVAVVDKLAAPSAQDRAAQAAARWEEFWILEEDLLRQRPLLIGVAVVPKDVVRGTWRRYEHLFYRVYQHHIFLNDLPAEDIRDGVFDRLEGLGFELDDAFMAELEEYIRVVYPEADLKYRDFVADLTERVLTAYYSVHTPEERLTRRCVPYYRRPRSFDDIIARLDGMVGMGPVKEAFQELYYQAQGRDRKTPLRLHMAFMGNPGTGKTTVARMMAELLYAMGLTRKNKLVSAKPADLISPWVGQTSIQTRDICRSAYGGVLFIDEAYTLTYDPAKRGTGGDVNATAQCVDTLLQEMEDNADRLVVIFAGYPAPMERFLNSNEGLRSRVTRVIRFPDYTEEELLQIFHGVCAREGFSVAEEGGEALRARIAFEKSGENFGNARSVENIFQSIRAEWQKEGGGEKVFTRAHIRATMPEQRSSDISSMIGLDDVKEQLKKFERRVGYIKTLSEKGVRVPPMSLHMLFTGNPGTGKTTVARAIAEDLYEIGMLKTNKCICVEARNLIDPVPGQAAAQVHKEIQRAMGGVLFLDEAYALTEYASRDIGREVVAALITAMEEHRGEFLVIVAGYPDNMRRFLEVNPGLASRIGFTFHFRDYKPRELTDIFLSKMQRYGYLLAGEVTERVEALMEYFHVMPGFGNGRFVDNVIDQTITRRALREEEDPCRYNEITVEDIPDVKAMLDAMPDGDQYYDPAGATREERLRTAVHEMGHALVSLLLAPEARLTSVSIAEQALSLGRVRVQRSGGNPTERQLMNHISIALAGRGAERVVFGTHTTGCYGDYESAKATAKNMLEYYAMGPELGAKDTAPLLNQANRVTMDLLTRRKDALVELAERLLDRRTLTDEELRQYLDEHELWEAAPST